MPSNIRCVFISHIHEDDSRLKPLKDLIEKSGVDPRDYSINSDKPNRAKAPDYIKSQILAPRIKQCSTMIVLISPGTRNSDYVDWEIRYAMNRGIRVVGVWDHGASECDIPQALIDFGSAVVGWRSERIGDALNGEFDGMEQPDGHPMPPQPMYHHNC